MEIIEKIIANVERVIKGKREVIELSLIPLISGGHLIFIDVPGVGKTTLASALANSIEAKFTRIQFTADLLPSDIVGVSIYKKETGSFEFKKGPVFANIVLADEINRASPKTQSALLEAMSEKTVTVDDFTYNLDNVFLVIATENPSEFSGVYPLPESELDRFMLSIRMGYPSIDVEKQIIREGITDASRLVKPVASLNDILLLRDKAQSIYVEDTVLDYVMKILHETRRSRYIQIGVSTRGGIEFLKAIKCYALIRGRDFVTPDDVKLIATYAIPHRVVLKNSESRFADEIIADILNETKAPV
ncbi:MAG: AAA family ATPase [Caldisericaceae bacterium]